MVKLLLYQCCETRIDLHRKSVRGEIMQLFSKASINPDTYKNHTTIVQCLTEEWFNRKG